MEAIGHKLFQLGDPEGKGFIVRRDMQVRARLLRLHASTPRRYAIPRDTYLRDNNTTSELTLTAT